MDFLRAEYEERKDGIRQRLVDFATVGRDQYFYELVYCLLTPQSSAANAGRVVSRLQQEDFLASGRNPAGLLRRPEQYIRFHNTKARRLLEARASYADVAAALSNGSSTPELREWLVKHVSGLGWKEASHFLRNIGHRNVAILDRHILKNLKAHNVLRVIPGTLTRTRYLAIEHKFARFANHIGIPMDELDLLFWSRETGEVLK